MIEQYPEIVRGLKLLNRMENGFEIKLSHLTFNELQVVEHLQSWKSDVEIDVRQNPEKYRQKHNQL